MTSKMVAYYLQPFGHVITTSNSRQATANYAVSHPDIVFLDIHYQDDLHDGFDVLINLLSADAKAFVVTVSGDRDPATILKALWLVGKGLSPSLSAPKILSTILPTSPAARRNLRLSDVSLFVCNAPTVPW